MSNKYYYPVFEPFSLIVSFFKPPESHIEIISPFPPSHNTWPAFPPRTPEDPTSALYSCLLLIFGLILRDLYLPLNYADSTSNLGNEIQNGTLLLPAICSNSKQEKFLSEDVSADHLENKIFLTLSYCHQNALVLILNIGLDSIAPSEYPKEDFISKYTSGKNLVMQRTWNRTLFSNRVVEQPLMCLIPQPYKDGGCNPDILISNHTISLAIFKCFQTSASIYLFIFLKFLLSSLDDWMTLTLQSSPKSKHFAFNILFFQRRFRVIIQAITDSISGTSYLFFSTS